MRTPRSSVASAERKELYSADSCDCDARARQRQHGRNIIHGGGGSVEFPVPCWRRHSDSSLSPFHSPARSFFLIFSFSRAAARTHGPSSDEASSPSPSLLRCVLFSGKGRRRYANAIGQCAFCAFQGTYGGTFRLRSIETWTVCGGAMAE